MSSHQRFCASSSVWSSKMRTILLFVYVPFNSHFLKHHSALVRCLVIFPGVVAVVSVWNRTFLDLCINKVSSMLLSVCSWCRNSFSVLPHAVAIVSRKIPSQEDVGDVVKRLATISGWFYRWQIQPLHIGQTPV